MSTTTTTTTTKTTTIADASSTASNGAATSITTTTTTTTKFGRLNWTRLNYKGIDHDNRRLLEHRAKNCECHICYRELHKLPPPETYREIFGARHLKHVERDIKKAKRQAKKEVKAGKQATIKKLFK